MAEYYRNNFSNENNTASCLVSGKTYERFFEENEYIGYGAGGYNSSGIFDRNINPNGSMFVAPSEEIDKILKDSNGDVSKIEKALGFPEGYFGDGPIYRVDINNPYDKGLRDAQGNEPGANCFFNTPIDEYGNLPNICFEKGTNVVDIDNTDRAVLEKLNGQYFDNHRNFHPAKIDGYEGKTSQGVSEGVIDQTKNTAENVSYTKIDGLKRGENSDEVISNKVDGNYNAYSKTSVSEGVDTDNNRIRAPSENNMNPNFSEEKSKDVEHDPRTKNLREGLGAEDSSQVSGISSGKTGEMNLDTESAKNPRIKNLREGLSENDFKANSEFKSESEMDPRYRNLRAGLESPEEAEKGIDKALEQGNAFSNAYGV